MHGASNLAGGGRKGLRERIERQGRDARASTPCRLMNENKAVIGFNLLRTGTSAARSRSSLQPLAI